jgi:hypothetical protein
VTVAGEEIDEGGADVVRAIHFSTNVSSPWHPEKPGKLRIFRDLR